MPDGEMMEMDSNALAGPGGLDDADDLITYDENDGIEWIQHTNVPSTNHPDSAAHDQSLADAPPTDTDLGIIDIEITEEIHGDGDLLAEGSDIKMISAGPSVAEEERHAPEEVDDIDWDANAEDTHDDGGVESFQTDEHLDRGVTTSGDVIELDEEILYDEEDYDTDSVVHPEAPQIAENAATASLGAGIKEDTNGAINVTKTDKEFTAENVDEDGNLVSGEQTEGRHEITYEEEEDEEEEGEEDAYADGSGEEYHDERHGESGSGEHPDGIGDEEEPIFVKEVAIVIDDAEEDAEDDNESTSGEIPMVSVCYKDDEFPLFRGDRNSNDRMPFFSTTAALESTMDTLLASFRQELSDELGPFDEIVFQVEELGLEYAESTSRDTLISVTLKQLLEIFNLLVKNQDPDANPRLYTNLFTRPSATKRLEILVEDAFAGKALNEVSYKFRSHVSHGSLGHGGNGEGDDHQHRYLEAYESYEESQEALDAEEADYGETNDDEAEIEDDDEPSNQSSSGPSNHPPNESAGLGTMFDDQAGAREVEAPMTGAVQDEEEYEDDDEAEQELDAASALDAYTNEKAYDDDIEHENDGLDHQDQYHDEVLHDELELTHQDASGDVLSKETNTSGTATLNGEDEIDFGHESGEVAAISAENGPLTIDLEGEEEAEDEINWNEATEPVEQPPNVKRPREEEAAEDQVEENDFKRRRS